MAPRMCARACAQAARLCIDTITSERCCHAVLCARSATSFKTPGCTMFHHAWPVDEPAASWCRGTGLSRAKIERAYWRQTWWYVSIGCTTGATGLCTNEVDCVLIRLMPALKCTGTGFCRDQFCLEKSKTLCILAKCSMMVHYELKHADAGCWAAWKGTGHLLW